jgi:transposase
MYKQRRDVWDWYLQGHSLSAIGRLAQLPRLTYYNIITHTKEHTSHNRFINKPRFQTKPKLNVYSEQRLLYAIATNTQATLTILTTPLKSRTKLSHTIV